MAISRRRFLAGGLAGGTLLGTGALGACSTAPSSSPGQAGSPDESGPTTLQLWFWPSGFSDTLMGAVKKQFPNDTVKQSIIGGDFKQKLTTAFSAKSNLPDITGLRGEEIAYYLDHAEYFLDLNTLGFDKVKSDYLDWKVKQGQAANGQQVGFPIDIGPTVTFYRFDIFGKAKLPTEPDAVGERTATWDDYFRLGQDLIKALPKHYLIRNAAGVFDMSMAQQPMLYVDQDNTFVGDQEHVRTSWQRAVAALNAGIVARIQSNTPDVQAAVNRGELPADFGASWHLDDLQGDAPKTKGKWHITGCPGGAANLGGSFLAIPKGVAHPDKSYEVISFMLNADNQEQMYTEKGSFPSMPATYESEALQSDIPFLGGQKAIDVFGPAAQSVKAQYQNANDSAVGAPFDAEIQLVEAKGKDAGKAFDDAVAAAKKLAKQLGVKVK